MTPRGIKAPTEDTPVDLSRMNLKFLEELVGRPPVEVRVENKYVVCDYKDVTIRFRKW